jgi:hypothetical protein
MILGYINMPKVSTHTYNDILIIVFPLLWVVQVFPKEQDYTFLSCFHTIIESKVQMNSNKPKLMSKRQFFAILVTFVYVVPVCHFNGMRIMESCAYCIIWILKNLK